MYFSKISVFLKIPSSTALSSEYVSTKFENFNKFFPELVRLIFFFCLILSESVLRNSLDVGAF